MNQIPDSARFLANCSLLFTEVPLLERPRAAALAGFDAIEFWWPFQEAVPADKAVSSFVTAVRDAGVSLASLNFWAGDLAGPDCGALAIPGWRTQFLSSVDIAVGIGEQLGARVFNALYGNRIASVSATVQDDAAMANLAAAAGAASRIGATVVIEAVSGPKPYPLRTADQAVAVVQKARANGSNNVAFLCDIYHLTANGDDLDAVIARHCPLIGHVQVADFPGRGEPGSGQLDIARYQSALLEAGYSGWISLEYRPTTTTIDSLTWLPVERRGRRAIPGTGGGR